MKICDKCGASFKPTDHGISKIKLSVYDGNHSSWPDGRDLDYCHTCTEEIKRVLMVIK